MESASNSKRKQTGQEDRGVATKRRQKGPNLPIVPDEYIAKADKFCQEQRLGMCPFRGCSGFRFHKCSEPSKHERGYKLRRYYHKDVHGSCAPRLTPEEMVEAVEYWNREPYPATFASILYSDVVPPGSVPDPNFDNYISTHLNDSTIQDFPSCIDPALLQLSGFPLRAVETPPTEQDFLENSLTQITNETPQNPTAPPCQPSIVLSSVPDVMGPGNTPSPVQSTDNSQSKDLPPSSNFFEDTSVSSTEPLQKYLLGIQQIGMHYQKQQNALQEQNAKTQTRLESTSQQLIATQNELGNKSALLADARTQQDELVTDHGKRLRLRDEEEERLKAIIAKLEFDKRQLEETVKSASVELKSQSDKSSIRQIEAEEREAALIAEKVDLRSQLDKASSSSLNDRKQISKLTWDNDSLRDKYFSVAEEASTAQRLQAAVESLTKDNKDLTRDNKELSEKLECSYEDAKLFTAAIARRVPVASRSSSVS